MKPKTRKSIVMNIPGGWYGSDPGWFLADPKLGVVAVDSTKIADAIAWLKRFSRIVETRVTEDVNPGVLIHYQLR